MREPSGLEPPQRDRVLPYPAVAMGITLHAHSLVPSVHPGLQSSLKAGTVSCPPYRSLEWRRNGACVRWK